MQRQRTNPKRNPAPKKNKNKPIQACARSIMRPGDAWPGALQPTLVDCPVQRRDGRRHVPCWLIRAVACVAHLRLLLSEKRSYAIAAAVWYHT